MSGLTYAEIGQQLGISRQRAQQLVKPDIYVQHAVKRRAHGRCESCHVPLKHGHLHHKQAHGLSADTYNDTVNLEYLCVRCHLWTHWQAEGPPDGFFVERGEKRPRRPTDT